MPFFEGSTNFVFLIFCSVLAFKNNRHTKVILISIFENAQKNVINDQKGQNGVFDGQEHFFVRFKKYRPKEHLCVYCF